LGTLDMTAGGRSPRWHLENSSQAAKLECEPQRQSLAMPIRQKRSLHALIFLGGKVGTVFLGRVRPILLKQRIVSSQLSVIFGAARDSR